jgi:hypothetical protein
MDIQKAVMLIIATGVIGVLVGLALWVSLYGIARNRTWSVWVRTPCYLILFFARVVRFGPFANYWIDFVAS